MQFVKPMPFAEAIEKLGAQSPVGAALSSSEWSDLPVELRENAFFSANVESVRFLQSAKDSINDFISGNTKTLDDGQTLLATGSRAAFVDQMQKLLAAHGVQRSGGGLQDITSEKRLGLIFNIKTQQAADYGYWRQGMDPDVLNEFPASRFIRVKAVKEPRLLHNQFENQVYLKTDPIWALLINQDFHVPWGPWGWGCGHDVEDVDRDETDKMGLTRPGQKLVPQKKFLNTNLQASAKGIDPELLAKIKKVFGDKIVIEGDTIRWRQEQPAPTPASPVPTPVTVAPPAETTERKAPVSAAVIVATTKKAAVDVNRTLALIDQVHDDGQLRPLTLNHHVSAGAQGTYYGGADRIGIRRTRAVQREMTVAHEIGHWLDDLALPGRGYSSQNSPALQEWRDAVNASSAIKNLQTQPGYVSNPFYQEYVLRGREIWARCYAQYIATRSGDAAMQQQIKSVIAGQTGYWSDSQWTQEDFEPIAATMDKLFKSLGWL